MLLYLSVYGCVAVSQIANSVNAPDAGSPYRCAGAGTIKDFLWLPECDRYADRRVDSDWMVKQGRCVATYHWTVELIVCVVE